MKKEYVKPYLAVESFQLDASIASGCGIKLYYSGTACTMVDDKGEKTLDINFGPACEEQGGINMLQEDPDICYHAMAGRGIYLES